MTDLVIPEPVPDIPPPPSPTQSVTDFKLTAWAWTAAQQPLFEWLNGAAQATHQNAVIAKAAETSTASLVAADKWQAGVNYEAGAGVYSPLTGRSYRRREPGGVTSMDPALDRANWIDILDPWPVMEIAVSAQAVAGMHHVLLASGITLTLPAAPTVGDVVDVSDLSGARSNVIDPAGKPVRGAVWSSIAIDVRGWTGRFRYINDEQGWVV